MPQRHTLDTTSFSSHPARDTTHRAHAFHPGLGFDVTADHVIEADPPLEMILPVEVPTSRWRRWCDSLPQTKLAYAAALIPGFGQVVNRDYWKLPVFYGGMAGFTALGFHFTMSRQSLLAQQTQGGGLDPIEYDARIKEYRAGEWFSYIGAGVMYSLSVVDALYFHQPEVKSPVTAMFASALLPGLGQVYTRQYWKVPVIYGAGIFLGQNLVRMAQLTKRFDKALTYLLDDDPNTVDEFEGKRNPNDLENMRDFYQRWRDFNTIMLTLLYALNVLDAYVGAHLFYWNVNENLAMNVGPALTPAPFSPMGTALAMNLNLKF